MITSKIKNINTPEQNYNYLKSIKDKENIIVSYYKKLSHLGNDKPKILPKIKKRTLKKNKPITTNNNNDNKNDNDNKHDNENDKAKLIKDTEKKTKKQIVIMDD